MLRNALVLLPLVVFGIASRAEEIPLETCDRLPVVQVKVSGTKFLFLVDTAATSLLNVKSFANGDPRRVQVSSWNGTVETVAQEITLTDLSVGRHHFVNLKLSAVDLSSIGRSCGRKIDGIFGIDLLQRNRVSPNFMSNSRAARRPSIGLMRRPSPIAWINRW